MSALTSEKKEKFQHYYLKNIN